MSEGLKEKLPFSDILKNLMEDRELTVREVAKMAGVSPSVVQSWLGRANPRDLRAVGRLAQAFGMSFQSLLLGENESPLTPIHYAELFETGKIFEGLCKVNITQLFPRSRYR